MIKTSGDLKFYRDEDGDLVLAERWWIDLPADIPEVRSEEDGITVTRPAPGISRVTVDAGFRWDGASGPTLDPKRWRVPPFVHDDLYRLLKYAAWGELPKAEHDRIRKAADDVFLTLMLERLPANPILRQIAKGRAYTWWAGVRVGASYAAKPRPRPQIERAA